jgi:hypoxanthine phosphoribosyltransferase
MIIMAVSKVPSKMVSWEEIERWSEIIVEKIGNEKFDSIISVIRGGLVPARIIADYLNIKDLYTLKTEHWGVTATPDGKAKITHPIVIDLTGKKVLVVDDITDTGQSLRLALDAARMKNPQYVKSATLLHIKRAEIVPDYYAEEITAENWKWFIFPWNRKEDLRNLVSGCIDGKMSTDEISRCLVMKHELFISKRELEETLEWLKKTGKIEIGEKINKMI